MDKCSNIKHPLQRDGRSQALRRVAALSPDYVEIDERSTGELLDFLYQYSKIVYYYNRKNQVEGDWRVFFELSCPFQIAIISKLNTDVLWKDYNNTSNAYLYSSKMDQLDQIFGKLFSLAQKINNWHYYLKETSELKAVVGKLISTNLQFALRNLIAIKNSTRTKIKVSIADFRRNQQWQLSDSDLSKRDSEIMELRGGPQFKFLYIKEKLDELYKVFFNGTVQIVKLAPDYLEQSIESSDEHEPHLGLLLGFIKVFGQTRDDLNNITKRHLDFFYRKVLRLQERKAHPDSSHLILDLAKQLDDHLLKEGIYFSADKDDKGVEMLFKLDEDMHLHKVQVESLQTLFLEPIKQEKNKCLNPQLKGLVNGTFIAHKADTADGLVADLKTVDPPSWYTFGASTSKVLKEESDVEFKSMPKAIFGFALASQALFLNEGKRQIKFEIKLKLPENPNDLSDVNRDALFEAVKTKYVFSERSVNLLIEEGVTNDRARVIKTLFGSSKGSLEFEDFLNELPESQLVNKFVERIHPFTIKLSGEKEWASPFDVKMFVEEQGSDYTLIANVILDDTFPPVINANPEVLGIDLGTTLPMAKFELDPDFRMKFTYSVDSAYETREISLYHYFRYIRIQEIEIKVGVRGIKNLIVQNDEGLQDPNKPFFPFGIAPKKDANFYIGSREVFHKNITNISDFNEHALSVNIIWDELPPSLFEHYRMYNQPLNKEIFEAEVEFLHNKEWKSLDTFKLFAHIENKYSGNQNKFEVKDSQNSPILTGTINYSDKAEATLAMRAALPLAIDEANYKLETDHYYLYSGTNKIAKLILDTSETNLATQVETLIGLIFNPAKQIQLQSLGDHNSSPVEDQSSFNLNSKNGFIRLKLGKQDFLHDKFPNVMTVQASAIAASANAKKLNNALYREIGNPVNVETGSTVTDLGKYAAELPMEPYNPIIKEISIDYTAMVDYRDIDFFHLYPYEGTYLKKELSSTGDNNEKDIPSVLACIEDEGNLFIGINNFVPGNTLSLLIQMADSTGDPDLEKAVVHWAYLKDNEWVSLETDLDVLSDATMGLIVSGIIKLKIPRDITDSNSIMPSGLLWIKAYTKENSFAVSETLGIHARAVKVTFEDRENDPTRLSVPLPAESITKLQVNNAAVKGITQAYHSFDGKPRESEDAFYTRVSERLRHKGRAMTLFDYERLVLEAFPEIYKIKCIPHTLGCRNKACDLELAPGYVAIAVIPDLIDTKRQFADLLEPKVPYSLLEKIQDYLKKRISPFVRLRVMNPRYEKINSRFKVKFYKGKSDEFYKKQLKEDLLRFLSPWAFGEEVRISFGGKIFQSSLIKFIENRSYVDYITDFTLIDEEGIERQEIEAKTARSILISGTHYVDIITAATCETSTV